MSTETHALRSDAQANQIRILDAARRVFAQHGLDAKLTDVAVAAEVGVGTIYRRFTNKEGLIEALFASRLLEMVALAEEANAFDDAWDGLVHFLHEASRRMAADHGLRDLMIPSGGAGNPLIMPATMNDDVLEARTRMAKLTERLVVRAKDSGALRPDFAATDLPVLVLAIQAGSDFARPHSQQMWQRLLDFVLDGLRTSRDGVSRTEVTALTNAQMDAVIGVG